MGAFKQWLDESLTDAGIWMGQAANDFPIDDPQTKAEAEKFKQEFIKWYHFVKKYDYIGIARTMEVTGVGYGKVAYDFATCLYSKLTGKGGSCNMKRELANVARVIPASILFGAAKYATPFMFDMTTAGMVSIGFVVLQYLYWPFWAWASRNIDNSNPDTAKKAHIIMAAIPDQFRDMLAVKKQPPAQKEWLEEQLAILAEHNPYFGELS